MRADRLVAILLLLQQRGRVTAAEVAGELEISERTARRDLEALGTAGLPVFSQQGRGGGWRLAGGGKTDLSGLTAAEARALFLVAGPAPSATPEVKAALRKLVRALPEPFRPSAEAVSRSIVVDPAGWNDGASEQRPPPPFLDAVQRVVLDGEQVVLGYVARDGSATTRVVHPLGLAAKGSLWYLVAGTDVGLRTFRVDRVTSVEPTGAAVERPDGFAIDEAWRMISDEVEEKRSPYRARARAAPSILPYLRWTLGATRVRVGSVGDDGRAEVELRSRDCETLAGQLGGFGADVEVLDPPELRDALRALAHELTELYGSDQAG